MYQHNYPCKVLLRKVQCKISNKSAVYQKTRVIRQIAAFIRSQGWKVSETSQSFNSKNGSESFSDILGTIAGRPVEVLIGVRKLSLAQSRYKYSFENAGGCYAVVVDRNSFESWYRETFKF